MLGDCSAFIGFAVDDVDAARAFYTDVLGLEVETANGMLTLHLGGGTNVLVVIVNAGVHRGRAS